MLVFVPVMGPKRRPWGWIRDPRIRIPIIRFPWKHPTQTSASGLRMAAEEGSRRDEGKRVRPLAGHWSHLWTNGDARLKKAVINTTGNYGDSHPAIIHPSFEWEFDPTAAGARVVTGSTLYKKIKNLAASCFLRRCSLSVKKTKPLTLWTENCLTVQLSTRRPGSRRPIRPAAPVTVVELRLRKSVNSRV